MSCTPCEELVALVQAVIAANRFQVSRRAEDAIRQSTYDHARFCDLDDAGHHLRLASWLVRAGMIACEWNKPGDPIASSLMTRLVGTIPDHANTVARASRLIESLGRRNGKRRGSAGTDATTAG